MVRLSLGIYSTKDDIDVAAQALTELWKHRDSVKPLYEEALDGAYHLRGQPVTTPVYLPSSYIVGMS
jgi:hypothetical protein